MNQLNQNSPLASDISKLIHNAKNNAAVAVNAQLTLLYWQVGKRINDEVLKGERADYGQKVLEGLAKQLTQEFGRGWSKRNLTYMVKFTDTFPDIEIVNALRAQLSWTHFRALIAIEDTLKREFYTAMVLQERWSTRILNERIDSQLFERTALSKKPENTIVRDLAKLREQGEVNQGMLLKDPYVLDFLELNDSYIEKDLEDAILREMEQFLLELGAGFSFIARQKRLHIGEDDFYIDLLFYNRKLKRLIAIVLKVGKFKSEYKGQMELYLRWLGKHEQEPDELPPLGIILCTDKNQDQIELLEMDNSGIHVAEYLTSLPSKELLEQRLHQAMLNARKRLENK